MSDGLIINGKRVPVPGVNVITWEDDPRVPRVPRAKRSTRPASSVTAIVLHTSRGKVGKVVPGSRQSDKALRLARYQARGSHAASWHLTVAHDGTVYQQADLATDETWHATQANPWTVGIELAQDESPDLTQAQVSACVATVRAVCEALGIPAWVPARQSGGSWSVLSTPVRAWQPRKQNGASQSARGVIGHRNLTTNRGAGDPGDGIFLALLANGFAGVEPEAMTADATTSTLASVEDATHDEDDGGTAPETAPLPAWLDPAREVDASRDLPDDLAAFVRAQARELAALGVTGDRAAELLAHCATECGRGRRAIGHNYGGVKAKEREYREAAAKGAPLGWWRDLGHLDAGDDEVEYYRAFESDADFWRYFVKRFCGGPSLPPSSERYTAAGRAFWGPSPAGWFVELVRAGYRGKVRAREIAVLADPSAHPSVVEHRALVERVKGLLA